MKWWQGVLMISLLVLVPVLSACGPSATKRAEQEHYRKVLEAIQEQRKAYSEQTQAYQEEMSKALEEYVKEYQKWSEQQQQQQIENLPKE